MVEAHASSRYQPGSAKKMCLIVDLIRDRDVPTALRTLTFIHKRTKGPVLKTLRSAVANAIQKAGKAKLREEDLVVTEARIDQGPMQNRWQPGPRGSASPILKRSVHVHVSVATRKGSKI
jgi:large subunit ribosomal protein L22